MGKVTGFKEYKRETPAKDSVESRIKTQKEFEHPFAGDAVKTQGARCMDCGIPFCHGDTGCPLHNNIPEWNDYIYNGRWQEALDNLHGTNNFPEFTGRLCPAPCEYACTCGINSEPVAIKAIERTIADKAIFEGWIIARPPTKRTGKNIAVIGSGPSGLAAAQQLARVGHSVTVYEKNEKPGGLLRYGIPDFKLEKVHIDRRVRQMTKEGVKFVTSFNAGVNMETSEMLERYDAMILACGSETPRDLPIPGRELKGVYFAMDYLVDQNRVNGGAQRELTINARGLKVVVIGGGDTGADCVGTAIRQGAASVTQIELFPKPPEQRSPSTPWPYWPNMLRTGSSHEEGVERRWSINTKSFSGNDKGELTALNCCEVDFVNGSLQDRAGSEFIIEADLVLLALGFVHPTKGKLIRDLENLGMELDRRGNVKTNQVNGEPEYRTTLEKVYAAGDVRRGQSLVVWAISEGRKCAATVHKDLMKNVSRAYTMH